MRNPQQTDPNVNLANIRNSTFLWLFAFLVIASVAAFAYSFYRQFEASTIDAHGREMDNLGRVLSEELVGDLKSTHAAIAEFSTKLAGGGQPASPADVARLRRALVELVQRLPQVSAVLFADKDGAVIADSLAREDADLHLPERDFFSTALASADAKPVIGSPFADGQGTRWSLPVSYPVKDTQGKPLGVLVATWNVDRLLRTFRTVQFGPGGRVGIFHRSGQVVASLPPAEKDAVPAFASLYLQRPQPSLQRASDPLSGRAAMLAFLPIQDTPLVIMVSRPSDEVLFGVAEQRLAVVGITIGVALAVLIFAGLFAQQLRQREESEKALRRSERDLREAERVGRLGSWAIDLRDNTVMLSDQALEILEMPQPAQFASPEEAVMRVVHPDEHAAVRAGYAEVLTGKVVESERRIVTSTGKVRWARTRTEAKFRQGVPVSVHGTLQEITEMKEAQLRLADSERGYRLLSENVRDLVSLHDVTGQLLFASHSFKRITGYAPIELMGHDFYSWVHPDDVLRLKAEIERQLRVGRLDVNTLFRFRHQDGHYLWLECLAASVHDEDGSIQHIQASSRDVTERQRALIALRDSEERFRRIIEFTSDLYWETDSEYRFTQLSVGARNYLGVVPHSLGLRRWESPYNRASKEVWEQHKADIDARRPFKDLLIEFIDPKTGETQEFSSISGEPFYDEDGEFKGYRGIGRFITRQKRYELDLAERTRQLSAANAELSREAGRRREVERRLLLAIEKELAQVGLELHDELGQNLTGTALLAKTLQKKLAEKGLPEAIDASRVHALVNETIRQTRLISHGLSPHILGPEGLIEALQQLADDVNSLGIIQCRFEADGAPRVTDNLIARGLYRIAQEAVNNALKHSHAKSIMIELAELDGEMRLAIIDNGVGIGSEDGETLSDSALHSIKYRAGVMNASLSVIRRPGGGTEVAVALATEIPAAMAAVRENQ
jgi:PAS domain S-box-containing protein